MKKNILLIVVDCARAEKTVVDLSGSTPDTRRSARLPFVDALRGRGAAWTAFFAVSSTTTPNFATLFTGRLPPHHGITEHSRRTLQAGIPTLAERLQAAGYFTCAEVTGPLIPEAGLTRGFHRYRYRPRTEYLHAGFLPRLQALLRELEDRRPPWFLCLHLWEAHEPYQNPPPFQDPRFGRTPYDRALSLVDHGLAEGCAHLLEREDTVILYTGDHGERLLADYALDRALGGEAWRVLATYRDFLAAGGGKGNGFDYDAWFDHAARVLGEARARIYAHNVLGHGFHLTEELVRIPLVIKDGERCPPGFTCTGLAGQADLFHTILDLAGLGDRAPGDTEGRSLLDFRARKRVYLEANGSGGKRFTSRCYLRGARTERFKYWRIEGGSEPLRVLWDLAEDPRETRNVLALHEAEAQALDAWVSSRLEGGTRNVPPLEVSADTAEARALERKMRELGYL